jgi:hypothetical protein
MPALCRMLPAKHACFTSVYKSTLTQLWRIRAGSARTLVHAASVKQSVNLHSYLVVDALMRREIMRRADTSVRLPLVKHVSS